MNVELLKKGREKMVPIRYYADILKEIKNQQLLKNEINNTLIAKEKGE